MEGLERFLDGQRFGYETALDEMVKGRKMNHWIWYIFPQIKGLGHSPNARFYGIRDLDEARDYLAHPILGKRLREITHAVLMHRGDDIYEIMGSRIDAVKLKSSMTLFNLVSPNDLFGDVLNSFFEGRRDSRTISLVEQSGNKS